MIRCSRCLAKINRELHEVASPIKCPACKQEVSNLNAIQTVTFPELISKVRYVGVNSWDDANRLMRMMQGGA